MFNAGFVEASSDQFTFEIAADTSLDSVDAMSEYTALGANPEDSDEEDEAFDPGEADADQPNSDAEPEDLFEMTRDLLEPGVSIEVEMPADDVECEMPADGNDNGEGEDGKARNVRQKVEHPSSPRASDVQIIPRGVPPPVEREVSGPPKLRVVVKDVAYATYRAVLYYVHPLLLSCLRSFDHILFQLYTDRIRFAPLSSSFLSSCSSGTACTETPNDSQGSLGSATRTGSGEAPPGASSRREWIRDWVRGNPGQTLPCSAKAVYRLADSESNYLAQPYTRRLTTSILCRARAC